VDGYILMMEGSMNIRAGICEDCGRYWTVTGGGLNEDGQCRECEARLPARHIEDLHREANDYELPHDAADASAS